MGHGPFDKFWNCLSQWQASLTNYLSFGRKLQRVPSFHAPPASHGGKFRYRRGCEVSSAKHAVFYTMSLEKIWVGQMGRLEENIAAVLLYGLLSFPLACLMFSAVCPGLLYRLHSFPLACSMFSAVCPGLLYRLHSFPLARLMFSAVCPGLLYRLHSFPLAYLMFSAVLPWPPVSRLADLSEPMFSGQGEKVGCFYGNKYRRLHVSRLADLSGPMFWRREEKVDCFDGNKYRRKEFQKWRDI